VAPRISSDGSGNGASTTHGIAAVGAAGAWACVPAQLSMTAVAVNPTPQIAARTRFATITTASSLRRGFAAALFPSD